MAGFSQNYVKKRDCQKQSLFNQKHKSNSPNYIFNQLPFTSE